MLNQFGLQNSLQKKIMRKARACPYFSGKKKKEVLFSTVLLLFNAISALVTAEVNSYFDMYLGDLQTRFPRYAERLATP